MLGKRPPPPPKKKKKMSYVTSRLLYYQQIYAHRTDFVPLKIYVFLTLTYQCHSRSNLTVQLNS